MSFQINLVLAGKKLMLVIIFIPPSPLFSKCEIHASYLNYIRANQHEFLVILNDFNFLIDIQYTCIFMYNIIYTI